VQALHAVADGFDHAAHLPVTAFVERDLDSAPVDAPDGRGGGRAVVEEHAVAELL
jgi:hypothetical protein